MSAEIEKQTKITLGFDLGNFKWFQTIALIGIKTAYVNEVTFEISQEAAKNLLSELEYTIEPYSSRIDFHIK